MTNSESGSVVRQVRALAPSVVTSQQTHTRDVMLLVVKIPFRQNRQCRDVVSGRESGVKFESIYTHMEACLNA